MSLEVDGWAWNLRSLHITCRNSSHVSHVGIIFYIFMILLVYDIWFYLFKIVEYTNRTCIMYLFFVIYKVCTLWIHLDQLWLQTSPATLCCFWLPHFCRVFVCLKATIPSDGFNDILYLEKWSNASILWNFHAEMEKGRFYTKFDPNIFENTACLSLWINQLATWSMYGLFTLH